MRKWEYKITSETLSGGWTKAKPDAKLEERIRVMGADGWEMYQVIPGASKLGASIDIVLFWKREIG